MYNWMKWLQLLGDWHFVAATAIKPPKAACHFAADDILLYEFCYYNPMDLLHHLGKDKEESSPLQYHIKFLQYQDITRWVCWEVKYTMDMKNYLRTQITLYEEDKKEEASMRCSLLHGSWDQILQRCPSVHLSVCLFPSSLLTQ